MLLPPSLKDLIDINHPARVVNRVIDQIEIDPVIDKYKRGGTSSYHPRMLLKVVVFAYLLNIYSSRRIEAALKENIYFMWISGMSQPDHNTINRFRSEQLKGVLKQVFGKVVELLVEEGLVNLKEVYTDGTKIELHHSPEPNRYQNLTFSPHPVQYTLRANARYSYGRCRLWFRAELSVFSRK